MIKSEFCVACGRRTKFGKMCLRCQDCRVVTHPECRDRCPMPCNPIAVSTPMKTTEVQLSISATSLHPNFRPLISWETKWLCCVEQVTLADFAPVTAPQIPALVIYCIKEIEQRGLHEVRRRLLSRTCPPFPSVL